MNFLNHLLKEEFIGNWLSSNKDSIGLGFIKMELEMKNMISLPLQGEH